MNNKQNNQREKLTVIVTSSCADTFNFFSLVLLGWLCLVLSIHDVNANININVSEVEIDQIKSGSLLFKSDNSNRYQEAPVLETEVDIEVTGMIARTILRQKFKNDHDNWIEGIYVFPLPEDAAVDHLRMEIGERIIEGVIKEREDAKRTYQQARRDGKKAALIEQERPNLFTNSVANIGPGETVVVEIQYQQILRYDNGAFSLRFPMAITPRYIPGTPFPQEEEIQFNDNGWAVNTDQVPDASRITPSVREAKARRNEEEMIPEKINPVHLSVTLNSGFKLDRVTSTYHRIITNNLDHNRTAITLADGQVSADRDFELVWQPEQGMAPRAALFTEQKEDKRYHLLMVLPPKTDNNSETASSNQINREVIYVIDTSGSMSGTSIDQAKQALTLALQRLKPNDSFNVIAFNSDTHKLFSVSRLATGQNIRSAQRYVSSLEAEGGTEIQSALAAALLNQQEISAVRQVIFLTDGSVGNEAALFEFIKKSLGNSRLFTIGIGSAPNSHFMSKAAQFGRGTFTYIGDISEVQSKMAALFQKLETTVMTEVTAIFPDLEVEMWPQRLPDLYQGEPLLLTARTTLASQNIVLSGQRQHQKWSNTLSLAKGSKGTGIATLWARNKIAALMDSLHEGEQEADIKPQVINVALQHHLVSKYTSLVAVDLTPSRPDTESLHTQAVPVNLPKGTVHEKIFGRHAQTATPAQLQLIFGILLLLATLWMWCKNKKTT